MQYRNAQTASKTAKKRALMYIYPLLILAVVLNIPKFLEVEVL